MKIRLLLVSLIVVATGLAAPKIPIPSSLSTVVGVTDIKTLLPKENPENVFEQWQNSRYGILLMNNGVLALVYTPKGDKILSTNGWYLQGAGQDDQGKNFWNYLGSANDSKPEIEVSGTTEGFIVYEITGKKDPYFIWKQRITCKPFAIRIEIQFTVDKTSKLLPSKIKPNLFINNQVLAKVPDDFNMPGENPIDLSSSAGKVYYNYDPRLSWYKGYWVDGKGINLAPLIDQKLEMGKTYSTWYELSFGK